MKRRTIFQWLAGLAASPAEALTPMASVSLEEQVRHATHVFVGVTTDVRYAHVGFRLAVRVVDPLFPPTWNPGQIVILYEQLGLTREVAEHDLVAKKWIFVTQAQPHGDDDASAPYGSIEPLDKLDDIRRMLRLRQSQSHKS